MKGAKIFSNIDLKLGYHQVKIYEVDIHRTIFCTKYGYDEFTIVPFGLKNVPSMFIIFVISPIDIYPSLCQVNIQNKNI